ncbi:MAG TPA: phenylalanine--tRNA ligase subunit beta [Planctomycetes bacterium]|nr:phenylalanine--tRNA ligase subunit beta [Planctomycetota bacterium]HIL36468.1 phenylalanine--tRNA ligase subunit beta [Planctomycetota bacterium]
MLISMRWLGRHVDLSGVDPEQLALDLTLSTAEVEGVERFAPYLSDVVVGHVLEREKHPDADKLCICKLDVGTGESLQIVCGAPNVAAGQRVAVATVGTVLPGDFKIKKSKIRGVHSVGMICSERELGLSDEHDGIWVLPGEPTTGAPVAEALGIDDWVLEIDNKSLTHRPDLWGHRGVAREVAAILDRPLLPLDTSLPELGGADPVKVLVESPACSRYIGLSIDGVGEGKTPDWMRCMLLATGQRPIDLLVDLSNFVMGDLGQPNHTFDRDQLARDGILVREAREGETLVTLDEVERKLRPADLLICSGDKAVALAGIMGGQDSKVQQGTGRLLLEVACFEPVPVRRTSARLGLRTDSSARFEKHLDPTLPLKAAGHFARLLQEFQPDVTFPASLADAGDWSDPACEVALNPDQVRRSLGVGISDEEMSALLSSIDFGVQANEKGLMVSVPSNRATKDIAIEMDLIEEVGRLYRYGNIPERHLTGALVPPPVDHRRELAESCRDLLAGGARFHETLSYSFQSDALHQMLGLDGESYVSVINPVQEGSARIRRQVLPSLLGLLEPNRRQRDEVRLFEIGKGYLPEQVSDRGEPGEVHELALVLCKARQSDTSFDEGCLARLMAVVQDLLSSLEFRELQFVAVEQAPVSWVHPVRRVELRVGSGDGACVGFVAELDPGLATPLGIDGELVSDTAVASISLDALLEQERSGGSYNPLPRYPGFKIDVAIVAPEEVPARDLSGVIEKAGKGNAKDLVVFDLFRGDQLGAGRRSLAYHLVLQSDKKTLTDKDAQSFLRRLERGLGEIGAELRS